MSISATLHWTNAAPTAHRRPGHCIRPAGSVPHAAPNPLFPRPVVLSSSSNLRSLTGEYCNEIACTTNQSLVTRSVYPGLPAGKGPRGIGPPVQLDPHRIDVDFYSCHRPDPLRWVVTRLRRIYRDIGGTIWTGDADVHGDAAKQVAVTALTRST